MALIRPGTSKKRKLSFRGVVVVRNMYNRLYAQKWPRSRGRPSQSYQRAGLERMTASQEAVKRYHPRGQIAMKEALDRFLRRHRGVRGTAAIRFRDWQTQNVYGRAFAVDLPDGRTLWPATVHREVSDVLDWLEPRLGSVLTRTPDGWRGTIQCRPDAVLVQSLSRPLPTCCPPADIPPAKNAMGGFPGD